MLIFGKIENIDGSSSGSGDYATLADLATKVTKELDGTNIGDKAKIQNQTDGGVMQYVSADKSNSAITVNDGSQDVGAEICSLDPDGNGSRIIANKTGAYYAVGNAINVTPEKEIAVKGDLADKVDKAELDKYIPINVKNDNGTTAYMANEKDGGIMKVIREDGTFSKVTLNDGTADDAQTMLQLYIGNKEGTKRAKINGTLEGLFYTKESTVTPNDELVVKKDIADFITSDDIAEKADKSDLKKYTETKLVGDNGTALIFNEIDGGGAKFEASDGIQSFVGVNDGKSVPGLYAQIYADKNVDGKWQGAKIDVTNDGIYYTVGDKSFTERKNTENELVVKKDLEPYAKREELDDYTTDSDFNILKTQIQTTYITKEDVETNYFKKLDALDFCPMSKVKELEARIAALEGGGA